MSILPHPTGSLPSIPGEPTPARIVGWLEEVRDTLHAIEDPWVGAKAVRAAEMVRYLAQKADMALEVQNNAASVVIRARRQAGELLLALHSSRPGPRSSGEPAGTTYVELGVPERDARRWQEMAKVPDNVVEAYEAKAGASRRELTAGGLVPYARNYARQQEDHPDDGPVHVHSWVAVRTCSGCGERQNLYGDHADGQPVYHPPVQP